MRQLVLSAILATVSFPLFAVEVAKEDWLGSMKSALPVAFCQSQQYFRQCFEVTATECEDVAAASTRVCLKQFEDQIPNVLVQPKDGTHWGTKVGECAGKAYEATLSKKRISNSRCNDLNNWR